MYMVGKTQTPMHAGIACMQTDGHLGYRASEMKSLICYYETSRNECRAHGCHVRRKRTKSESELGLGSRLASQRLQLS